MGNKNRRKGHNFERESCAIFKDLGFNFVKTSRQANSLADSCGIDLVNIPFLVQNKMGYAKRRPKYDVIYRIIKERIAENFPPDHVVHSLPIVLMHKIDGRKPENFTITFAAEDILVILKEYIELKKEKYGIESAEQLYKGLLFN